MITSRPAVSHPSVQAVLSGKRILLTGTTGFLAKVVLEKLIRSVPDIGRLILLIRPGRNGETARQRFEREIAASSIFDRLRAEQPRYLAEFFADRIECLSGEAAEPGLGLPAYKFIELAGRVDLVINGAASVNFREPLDQALAINTLSLHYLTALTRTANAPLLQVSTCYVNGYQRGDMREEIVAPAGAAVPRHRDGYYDVEALIGQMQRKIESLKVRVPAGAQRERLLTELGIRYANRYGWNDTYTFTKWLGEQLAMRGMQGRSLSIVRPSIIESTLQEPVPGWIEGVKVADAVILAYARGKTSFFPARRDEVIDIIPVDLVANSIVLAAAEALTAEHQHRIYQCCSGSSNPILLGDMIDLLQREAKRNWRHYDRLFHVQPTHDFRVVNHGVFRLALGAVQAAAAVWGSVRRALGAGASRSLEKLRTTQVLALTFSFYTQPRYRFFNTRLVGLTRRFDGREATQFPVDAQAIDWEEYLCRIHMPGLNRYALKRKDAAPQELPAETILPVVDAATDGALAG
jgi:alcohol-forming fatty acyl-CoA reductase